MDHTVEKDGHIAAARPSCYSWINPTELLNEMQSGVDYLLIDMRPFSLYCANHIHNARSLSFSPILMRRLLKGTLKIDTIVTDQHLLNMMANSTCTVIYDSSSTPADIRLELTKFAEALKARFDAINIKLLLGGIETFRATYPNLCDAEEPGAASSPSKITIDTSVITRTIKVEDEATPEGTPVEILPYLFLGSAKDSGDLRILQKLKVTSVLNITTSCPNHFESVLEYMSIPVEDSHQSDLLSKLQTAISYIDNVKTKGGRVFVHCHAGISRSATVCIAYLMNQQKLTLDEAYRFVQSKRPIISPNLGFMGQLMIYQQTLQALWANNTQSITSTTMTYTNHKSHTSVQVTAEDKPNPSIPPLFKCSGRSISVPGPNHDSSEKRKSLRLSLNGIESSSRKKVAPPQISPCRTEARNPLTLSLNLSTTCT